MEYLVHKRHRSIKHIQKALSDDGVFWLNMVNINGKDFKEYSKQFGIDMQVRAQRFYSLGVSLGKVIDLGNIVNTVYTVNRLMEEYETFCRNGNIETNAVYKYIFPEITTTFSQHQYDGEKR